MKSIVFYLMNEKALTVLKAFLEVFDRNTISYIVIGKDNGVLEDYSAQIEELCKNNGIYYYYRGECIPEFGGYKFAIGWRWMIADSEKLIVLHDSILPKYRGYAPLVSMLINGEETIGVTAIYANDNYDRGNIIGCLAERIQYPIKIKTAIEIISKLYAQLVLQIASKIFSNEPLKEEIQNDNEATYSLWRDQQDYFIDWNESAQNICRKIDAVGFPYNGARTLMDGMLIYIDDAKYHGDLAIENRDVGKVIFLVNGKPVVVCGKGLVMIVEARTTEGHSILPMKKLRTRFGGCI